MDYLKQKVREPNPRLKANIISNFLFCYTSPIFRKGLTTDIQEDDVYEVLPKLKSSRLGGPLKKEWAKSKYRNNPSIFLLLWNCYRFECACLMLAYSLCLIVRTYISPILIGMIVSYYAPGQTKFLKSDAVLYSLVLVLINVIQSVCYQNTDMAMQVLGIKFRASLSSFIYENALNFKSAQLSEESIGKITTLIAQDVAQIELASVVFVKLPGFLNTIIVLGLFYHRIGLPSVVVLLSFLMLLLIQVLFANWTVKLGVTKLNKIDERIQLTKDTLSALKTIKMYIWEAFFLDKISQIRKNEIVNINKIFMVHYLLKAMAQFVYYFSLFALILLYVWSKETITAGNIFFAVSSLQAISMSLLIDIPIVLHFGAQGLSALHRIQSVLKEIGSESTIQNEDTSKKESESFSIKLENVTVIIRDRTVLTNVSLNIDRGLTVLTGSTGSGKTMFLKTVLGENNICEGRLTIDGRLSYASQEPWLFPATIRQNIIFSEEFDQGRYKQVLAACALLKDFQLFEAGDLTIVADNAINLSKGQQSRINLARAVYRKADIYLIDDCLSCLDTIVADSVFKKCIVNFLNEQLVVFVTHRLDFLKYADMKIDFDKGRVISVEKIEAMKGNQEFKENFEIIDDNVIEDNIDTDSVNDMSKLLDNSYNLKNIYKDNQKFTKVSCTPYLKYIKFGGRSYLLWFMAGSFIFTQAATNYKDKLISKWADLEENISKHQRFNITNNNSKSSFELLVEERHITFCLYFFLIMVVALGTFGAGAFQFNLAKIVSINFHKHLMVKLVNAQMIFFSNNFMGNTLNRLYQDIAVLDHRLPMAFYVFIYVFLSFIGSFVMVVSVNYIFVLPMTIFIMILLLLRWSFIRTGRSLRRLNMSMSSAMIGHATSSLEGLTTIRVFGAKHILIKEFDKHQDLYISVNYMNLSCLTAFSLVGEWLSLVFLACVLITFLYAEDVSAGSVGLALSQSIILSFKANVVVKYWLRIETYITSVERLLEYTEIEQEPQAGLELEKWPKEGRVKYDNINLFYDENSKVPILQMLNFSIDAKKKFGIVGRTGSGKSSIISILFRLFNYEGTIFVGGADIKTLTLNILRSNISILPQDPLIFSGSIRDNIDPLKKYTDEEVWKVLGVTKLNSVISDLDFQITPDINLSVGQKQLISLTRVLLQKNSIIIFDEASELMDADTDMLIKNIIEENFEFYTLIVIAHKLEFVMNCDTVILLDKGKIVQHGNPKFLLENDEGLFFKMVQKSIIGSEHKRIANQPMNA